jgi:hypothetical protein
MAAHAHLSRGDLCVRRPLDIGMAVATVNSHLPSVNSMAVGHWLDGRIANLQVTGGRIIPEPADKPDERDNRAGRKHERQDIE